MWFADSGWASCWPTKRPGSGSILSRRHYAARKVVWNPLRGVLSAIDGECTQSSTLLLAAGDGNPLLKKRSGLASFSTVASESNVSTDLGELNLGSNDNEDSQLRTLSGEDAVLSTTIPVLFTPSPKTYFDWLGLTMCLPGFLISIFRIISFSSLQIDLSGSFSSFRVSQQMFCDSLIEKQDHKLSIER
mmetsp:Transcript_68660/g.183264  ORF Transcript_68660/g.183264 Transcript_68660/m.183264 type:complete len:189 (+) Transcript_68660:318-884(+)